MPHPPVFPLVRRVREAAEVEALCEPHQPAALLVSSPLGEIGAAARTACWAVGRPGDELGVLTTVRVHPRLTTASLLLHDPSAAGGLAALVRRSGAARLVGGAVHVDPLAALIPGARVTPLEMLARRDLPPARGGWRERGRVARPDDVEAIVTLYRAFPYEPMSGTRLEQTIAELVRQRRVVVAVDDDGVVVAAQRVEARSRGWDLWAGLTVTPEHRGKGFSRVVDGWAWETSRRAGRGTAGVRAPTNSVPHDVDGLLTIPWSEARLPVAPPLPRRAVRYARRRFRRAAVGAATSGP